MQRAFLCANWDGGHIWIQWPNGVEALRWRTRKPGEDQWGEWNSLFVQSGENLWRVIPTWREGHEVQAETCSNGEWTPAIPADFMKSTALFILHNKRTSDVTIPSGSIFHGVVDSAACAYELLQDIVIPPGKSVRVHMTALHASGYSQLDFAGHFHCETESLIVENAEVSIDDLKILPGDSTMIRSSPMAPVTLAILQ